MNHEERNVLVATVGLAATAVGTFLPWARIGGRSRSGFNTADTFISLAAGALPDQVAWVGRWWYLPAFLAFAAWATTFLRGHIALRTAGVLCVVASIAMWWTFVWAGRHYNVLNTQYVGPALATVGLLTIGFACTRRRESMLRSQASASGPNAPI